jgi:serine/threonine protein kinase
MDLERDNGDETSDDEPVDPSLVAAVVERLDNLWARKRQEAAVEVPNLVGRRVGKYTIRSIVGRGAFGVVYRATDDELRRDVALKVPRPEVLVDRERLGRFQSEAVAAGQLDHPGIVPVLEANLSGPTPYIVSALCAGPDLGEWLAGRTGPAMPRNAARFIARLAEAVHYAHQKGILHRDLKPSNILLEPLGPPASDANLSRFQPRLSDFGLAKLLASGLQDTRSSLLVGTPLYMAPEQLLSETSDFPPATDVYALGVMLYELLTLKTPFEGATYVEVLDKLRSKPSPPVSQLNPDVPRDLATICAKCLEKDPADRYESAGELADDLQRYVDGQYIQARPPTSWDKFVRWCRQPQRIATAGWFNCWYMSLASVWMWMLWAAAASIGAMQDHAFRTMIDMLIVTLSFGLPMALLGYFVMRRRSRRLFWVATALSGLHLVTIVHSLFQEGVFFAHVYPNLFSKLASYIMLAMGSLMQFGLYLLAIPALWRLRKD